ncbi:hypothetical protein L8X52_06885 [Campylobacter lari]|nr:hypothetical protein [Campylobacter lari]MCV3386177.1 hypothetical protein [Campylobacter lari]MCV3501347.1 hypothetical protein [Campylobacter lari]MCV3535743.1 hypothetical protein [Campylobacter lari]HEG5920034.1 hypothetical protein [Campylobacter lari]
MLKKILTSVICAAALYSSQDYRSDSLDRYLDKETKSYSKQLISINESEYISLCNNIVKWNNFMFYAYMLIPKYLPNLKDIEKYGYFQKMGILDKTITTSKKRMNDKNFAKFGNADLNVYYSSLATKNILETILDKDFIKITGGFDTSFFKEDFDIIEYGKDIEAVHKNITTQEKHEFALIRERAKEYECLFQI